MKKGSMILVDKIDTQHGPLTAEPGHELLAVFLGSVPIGEDPSPEERLHSLGWRQMAMFKVELLIHAGGEPFGDMYDHMFSCLGAVDAVEAAGRYADFVMQDQYVPDQEPTITHISVGLREVGPIAEDGSPHSAGTPAFFTWTFDSGVSWEDHLANLRAQAEQHAV